MHQIQRLFNKPRPTILSGVFPCHIIYDGSFARLSTASDMPNPLVCNAVNIHTRE
jgi:hypothetical protein